MEPNTSPEQEIRVFGAYTTDRTNLEWNPEDTISETERQRKLIQAVVRNNVDAIKAFLDSTQWYRLKDHRGLSLLHIAVHLNNKEAFNYLLSLPNVNLEVTDDYGATPLIAAIQTKRDHFAFELIKKGANIFYVSSSNWTTLHYAAMSSHVKLAEYLIENGIDINVQDSEGNTPLHVTGFSSSSATEFVFLLLHHGADLHLKNKTGQVPFECAILQGCDNTLVQEMLFHYTYDEYFGFKTNLNVLMRLAESDSQLTTRFEDVVVDYKQKDYVNLFMLDLRYLEMFLERFTLTIRAILSECCLYEWSRNGVTFEKVEFFNESDARDEMIACIQNTDDYELVDCLTSSELDESEITRIICYLLSYGFNLSARGLQKLYKKFGYCELFKISLHMDIHFGNETQKQIMPVFLYDTTMTLDSYLENYKRYSRDNVDHLLFYFANTKLNELCYKLYGEKFDPRSANLPQVPLLIELARNASRKYLIQKFGSKRFYSVVNALNIKESDKKILMYETVLYRNIPTR